MFSSKKVWSTLPVVLLFVFTLLFGLVATSHGQWSLGIFNTRNQQAAYGVVSRGTIDALQKDTHLEHTVLSLTESLAESSSKFGDRYNVEGLKAFARNLTTQVERLRQVRPQPKKKRGFLEDLGNLFTGGESSDNNTGGILSELGNALGLGEDGNSTGGLGGLLQDGISSLTDSIIGGLETPAMFLGIGLGYVF